MRKVEEIKDLLLDYELIIREYEAEMDSLNTDDSDYEERCQKIDEHISRVIKCIELLKWVLEPSESN